MIQIGLGASVVRLPGGASGGQLLVSGERRFALTLVRGGPGALARGDKNYVRAELTLEGGGRKPSQVDVLQSASSSASSARPEQELRYWWTRGRFNAPMKRGLVVDSLVRLGFGSDDVCGLLEKIDRPRPALPPGPRVNGGTVCLGVLARRDGGQEYALLTRGSAGRPVLLEAMRVADAPPWMPTRGGTRSRALMWRRGRAVAKWWNGMFLNLHNLPLEPWVLNEVHDSMDKFGFESKTAEAFLTEDGGV